MSNKIKIINYYVVINDMRSLPIFAAYDIYRKHGKEKAKILISDRCYRFMDYGQNFPLWLNLIKILVLKCVGDVIIINKTNILKLNNSMMDGVRSSLCSITSDSNADNEKYPKLYSNLVQQAYGAKEVADFINLQIQKPKVVYLFNGRTASSSALVSSLRLEKINIKYYEYSSKNTGYKIYPYPPHNSLRLGQDTVKLWKKNIIPINELYLRGIKYQNLKLKNKFTEFYTYTNKVAYDAVIFLGSDHEYTNLQLDIIKMKVIGNIGLVKYAISKYGSKKKMAVRAHPNQRNDPSVKIILQEIVDLCDKFGIVFYAPEDQISSYDLIINSSVTVVEYSSIAYDAIFLGANVDIVGDLDLKIYLNFKRQNQSIQNISTISFVREIMCVGDDLFYTPFKTKLVVFACRLLNYIEKKIVNYSYSNKIYNLF
jgi:hypothetical protein